MKHHLSIVFLGFILILQLSCKEEDTDEKQHTEYNPQFWPAEDIKTEEKNYRASMFPIPDADPIYNEGLTLGKVARSDKASLSSAQINQLLNIWVWQIPLSVPGDALSVSVYLEEYDGEQRVSTLAHHVFKTETKKGADSPVSDTITIALRFSDLQRSGTSAFWTSEYCWFSTDADTWSGNGFSSPAVIKNPFYKIYGSGIGYGSENYIDPSLSLENDFKKYTSEVERLAKKRRTNFQMMLLSVSGGNFQKNKGPNIRVSFRINMRRKLPEPIESTN